MIDATHIYGGLWQGGRPPYGTELAEAGFSLLVLCAFEFQPPHGLNCDDSILSPSLRVDPFPGLEVLYAPNDDDFYTPPDESTVDVARSVAERVASHIEGGAGKALVTCWQGWNRSGLVSALVLHRLLGYSGHECVQHIAAKRKGALSNPQFVKVLSMIRPQVG